MLDLLIQVVLKQQPELLPIAKTVGTKPLTDEQRECLRGVVADELVEKGFEENYVANAYGLLLEDLIDWLGHM